MKATFFGYLKECDGYGEINLGLLRSFQQLEPEMSWCDIQGWDSPGRWQSDQPGLLVCTPYALEHISAQPLFLLTMFEATRLPDEWAELINANVAHLIVPCAWNVSVFRCSGVTVPISVVPLGVSTERFTKLRRLRMKDDPYTFLWSGTPDLRKGWDVAYRAFCKAFGDRDDVQLILHFRDPMKVPAEFADANVRQIVRRISQDEWRLLLNQADCFVFPSRGEGWGMPPREAAASGLPVLATNWGGLAEDIRQWALPLGVCGMSKADFGYYDEVGLWAEPDIDELVKLMRLVVRQRDWAEEFGQRAADWMACHGNWMNVASHLLALMRKEMVRC